MSTKDMSLKDQRNPLKVARGLGSSQSGVGHWWAQRMTAAALVLLSVWFVVTVLCLLHADYATARAAVAKPWNALLLIAFVLSMFWHAVLGLQVVIEDYVHTRWKEVLLLVAIKFLAVLGALASVLAVLRIALTP
jgi:succinate dehydrogenase / fumarate reductase, membrane anchor subunit